MLIFRYVTKKKLKECIGQPLRYSETSIFGPEYTDNGVLTGSNRPAQTGIGTREFFAQVKMVDGLIAEVR